MRGLNLALQLAGGRLTMPGLARSAIELSLRYALSQRQLVKPPQPAAMDMTGWTPGFDHGHRRDAFKFPDTSGGVTGLPNGYRTIVGLTAIGGAISPGISALTFYESRDGLGLDPLPDFNPGRFAARYWRVSSTQQAPFMPAGRNVRMPRLWPRPRPGAEVGYTVPAPQVRARQVNRVPEAWVINPTGRPSPRARIDGRPARPKKGHHEEKFVMSLGPKTALAKVLSVATESGDFVEAFYSTLPLYLKRREYNTLQERAWAVWKHRNQVNFAQGFLNLVLNEIEDRAYGTLGKQAALVNRRLGRPAGIEVGPAL